MPSLPFQLPAGTKDVELIVDTIRKIHDFLSQSASVERITWQGVLAFPLRLPVETGAPFSVTIQGRTFPDDGSAVELSTPSWRYDATAGEVVVESIDGLTEGEAYTLTGSVHGLRE